MDNWQDSFDYPMSDDWYRGLSNYYEPKEAPNIEVEQRQQFIRWQDKQRELLYSSKESISPRRMLQDKPMSINHQHTVNSIYNIYKGMDKKRESF